MTENYYALLDVDRDASEDAILEAYREKAAEHHPDVSEAANAESIFQRLHEAKDVLTDEQRRREYDRVGHQEFVENSDTSRPTKPASRRSDVRGEQRTGTTARPSASRSLLRQALGGLVTQPLFAGIMRPGPAQAAGDDPYTIDLEDHFGEVGPASRDTRRDRDSGEVQNRPSGNTECTRCRGRGRFIHDIDTRRGRTRRIEPCEECGGSGRLSESE